MAAAGTGGGAGGGTRGTVAAGAATLKAKWTYSKDGQTAVVKEDTMTINATGPATHHTRPYHPPRGRGRLRPVGDPRSL